MVEIGKALSFKEKAKLEAEKQIEDEKMKEATKKLLELHRKLVAAEKLVKNIKNEITDYEMDLEE